MLSVKAGRCVQVVVRIAWQDTGDTRETPAIDVCKGLIGDNAHLNIYDPKVSAKQMLGDLSTPKCATFSVLT